MQFLSFVIFISLGQLFTKAGEEKSKQQRKMFRENYFCWTSKNIAKLKNEKFVLTAKQER